MRLIASRCDRLRQAILTKKARKTNVSGLFALFSGVVQKNYELEFVSNSEPVL